ncbi:MAG: type IV pilus secretin PilQ [Desulfobacteraceae bacterium]|nr:type IV pilus secretin PilQ [Desulfobacteraceae bacterium]
MSYFKDQVPKNLNIFFIIILSLGLMFGCAPSGQNQKPVGVDPAADVDNLVSIDSISTEDGADAFNIYVSGDRTLTYTAVKQPFPLGVILYFPGALLGDINENLIVSNDIVEAVNSMELDSESRAARIEILLNRDVAYDVFRQDNMLTISFDKSAASFASDGSSSEPAPELPAQTLAATSPQPTSTTVRSDADVQQSSATNKAAAGDAWLNRIDFYSEAAGKSRLVIGTTGPIAYNVRKISDKTLELRLERTKIPWYRQRPLITTRFASAVNRVVPYMRPNVKNESLVTIELREAVPYVVNQMDTILTVEFESSSIPPKPLEEAQLPEWRKVLSGTEMVTVDAPAGSPVSDAMTPISQPVSPAMAPTPTAVVDDEVSSILRGTRKVYSGEKIALDFYQTDIKNVFRILREVSGKNFAIDKDVTGSVTLTFEKPVPWDQVLDLILRMNQLGMVEEQDIVRIATLETLKKEADLKNARFQAAKQAKEKLKELQPLFTEYMPINYSNAADEIKPHIDNILTKGRGNVTVDTRNNQIIITDTADTIARAKEIISRIDRVTPQVIIEARIVEVSNSFSKELGITWNTSYGPGYSSALKGQGIGDMAMNFPSEANSSIGFNFTRLTGIPWVLDAKLNAVETTGQGRILSSPKILTLDNKKAKIKQGQEYPYFERDDTGGSSIKFKNIDLLLEVTPHITPDNRVAMKIFITKNDVAGIIAGVPSLDTNEAETEFLVNDGDTIVIGGIIKTTETGGESGFPVLSKIPVLGWMFKNQTNKKENDELLIFITPRIVQLEQANL